MQVVIDIVIAITAVYAAAMSTINQLQIRRQMQRILSVSLKQAMMDLPRIPDGSGGRSMAASVHVFVILVVNPGLTSVRLKKVGLILPDGTFLTQGFTAVMSTQRLPLELAPGGEYEVHIDTYDVLSAMKGKSVVSKGILQSCVMTPLKQYKSKKNVVDMHLLGDEIKRTEGIWRK